MNAGLADFTWLTIGMYSFVSLLTFILYGFDKTFAKKGKTRITENTLHLFALLGGWPGAFIAQSLFRHKTIKQPFRVIFYLTVLLNISLFTGLVILQRHYFF